MTIRVAIIDDQEVFRRGLRIMLDLEPDIDIVGEGRDGHTGVEIITRTTADVALVDARMPQMSGPEMISVLKRSGSPTKLLILTTFEDDELLLHAIRAGADGYLLKDATPDEIIDAIRRTAVGETVLGRDPLARLVALTRKGMTTREPSNSTDHNVASLSEREIEVAQLISRGQSNREISQVLFITEGTVKNHITSILRKMSLRDRTQLAVSFSGNGTTSVPNDGTRGP